jgi:phosphate transport system permease protein
MKYRLLKSKITGTLMLALVIFALCLVTVIGIGLYLKSIPILQTKPLSELLFTVNWKPLRGEFGFLPFIMGTIWVTGIAVALAIPVALLSAIFLTEYAKSWAKRYVFPVLDILASLPSVIYGVWGTLIIVPLIADRISPVFGVFSTGYTTLAGGIVLGVMILPLLVSLFVEIFSAVPAEIRDTSMSLGATKWQTIKRVVLLRTLPGILAAIVLSVSRALGETIAVLMVCGNLAQIPKSPLESAYPIPSLIANNYGEMLSLPLYESALMFAALLLFVVVFLFNILSRIILYRIEKKFAV